MTGPLYKWAVTGAEAENPFSDAALLEAMLQFEVALARAQARLELIPERYAAAIAEHAGTAALEPGRLAREGAEAGSVAIPFVQAVIAHVGNQDANAARYVHFGATSQDLLDTAAALCTRKAVLRLDQGLQRACRAATDLARRHADTPVLARTLLQPAAITTIGFKSAHWALGLTRGRRRLLDTADEALSVSLGGAVGNLAAYGEAGPALRAELARSLGLKDPGSTWHTRREGWIALASEAALATGTMAKIARDIALMAQAEIGEATEPSAPGRGASTSMPHKRNPVLAMRVLAATQAVPGMMANLLAAMPQEHERALGNWQAELGQYPDLLVHALSAANALIALLQGVRVDAERCRANIDALQGTILSERLASLLIPALGKAEAQALVAALCAGALQTRTHLRDLVRERLASDARLASVSPSDVDAMFDVTRAAAVSARQVQPILDAVAALEI
jgi:3-carboxy-cis,cis-muconate cycloisomerase